jgi:hypothetical protein
MGKDRSAAAGRRPRMPCGITYRSSRLPECRVFSCWSFGFVGYASVDTQSGQETAIRGVTESRAALACFGVLVRTTPLQDTPITHWRIDILPRMFTHSVRAVSRSFSSSFRPPRTLLDGSGLRHRRNNGCAAATRTPVRSCVHVGEVDVTETSGDVCSSERSYGSVVRTRDVTTRWHWLPFGTDLPEDFPQESPSRLRDKAAGAVRCSRRSR